MTDKVAVIGVGQTDYAESAPEYSYKEQMYEAAVQALNNAGLEKDDIQSIVTCDEDYLEGRAIADEFTPDQIGGAQKSNFRICADGLYGIFTAFMQINSRVVDLVLVCAHGKPSEVVNPDQIERLSFDPIFTRPLNIHPYNIPAMEMNRYLEKTKMEKKYCARVVVKNKKNALDNPAAGFGEELSEEEVLASEPVCFPLSEKDISPFADGAAVVILASERVVKKAKKPVWIEGLGWSSDASSAFFTDVDQANLDYIEQAAERAYKMAKIKRPLKEIDLAEIDDLFSFKELQSLEALKMAKFGEGWKLIEEGLVEREGEFPVNPSGGCLGMGYPFLAKGLQRFIAAVLQLRREAGDCQIKKSPHLALVQSSSGFPTRSGGVCILRRGG